MNKKILLFIFAIILFHCTAKKELRIPLEYLEKGRYLWAFQPTVYLRKDNSVHSQKVGELSDGDSVFVTRNKNGWYKVITNSSETGWIRSDLLGPRHLSAYIKAIPFIEGLKEKEGIEIFFDTKLQYKCIYISYSKKLYKSKSVIKQKTEQLGKEYQDKVYRGNITAHVLKPNSKDIFLSLNLKGDLNADPILPVLPFGQIERVENTKPEKISLTIIIQEEISNNRLLETARKLTSTDLIYRT